MNAVSNNRRDKNWSAPYLVADIGGTHARFSIAKNSNDDAKLDLENPQTYRVEEFDSISAALHDYLNKIPSSIRPARAVLAVASAVTNDQIQFTNSPWSFSVSALQKQLAFDALEVINDFAAVAWALPALVDTDLESIGNLHSNDMKKPGVYAALGPGTGLGVAALKIDDQGQATVIETEGGHMGFAPRNEDEIKVLQFLQKEYRRVSYERLLCGSGLVNLYRARSKMLGLPADLITPAEVSTAAKALNSPAARLAVQDFCSILGAFAGDTALMFGAWSGVYLSGGLLPHVLDDKAKILFRTAFEDKGRFSPLLQQTPVLQITRTDVGNLGAANFAFQINHSSNKKMEHQE